MSVTEITAPIPRRRTPWSPRLLAVVRCCVPHRQHSPDHSYITSPVSAATPRQGPWPSPRQVRTPAFQVVAFGKAAAMSRTVSWRCIGELFPQEPRGGSFDELLAQIRTLPRRALWRHNQAGDLTPSAPGTIDVHLLSRLAMANRGRRGFTYTHYPPTRANRAAIRQANQLGFAVNLSAETLAQADGYAVLEVAPVVVVLPVGTTKPTRTPSGRPVIVCPSSVGNTDCLSCGICQQRDRSVIVGFPAHGARARHVERILLEGRPS